MWKQVKCWTRNPNIYESYEPTVWHISNFQILNFAQRSNSARNLDSHSFLLPIPHPKWRNLNISKRDDLMSRYRCTDIMKHSETLNLYYRYYFKWNESLRKHVYLMQSSLLCYGLVPDESLKSYFSNTFQINCSSPPFYWNITLPFL